MSYGTVGRLIGNLRNIFMMFHIILRPVSTIEGICSSLGCQGKVWLLGSFRPLNLDVRAAEKYKLFVIFRTLRMVCRLIRMSSQLKKEFESKYVLSTSPYNSEHPVFVGYRVKYE